MRSAATSDNRSCSTNKRGHFTAYGSRTVSFRICILHAILKLDFIKGAFDGGCVDCGGLASAAVPAAFIHTNHNKSNGISCVNKSCKCHCLDAARSHRGYEMKTKRLNGDILSKQNK